MNPIGETLQPRWVRWLPDNAVPGAETRLDSAAAATTAPTFTTFADASFAFSSSSSGDGDSEVTAPTIRKLSDASSSSSGSSAAAVGDVGDATRLPPPSSGSLDDWSPPPGFWGSGVGDANETVRSPPSTPTPTPLPTEATTNVVTIGIAAGVAVAIVCAIVLFIRRRQQRQSKDPVETNVDAYVDMLMSGKAGDAPTQTTQPSQATTTTTADCSSTFDHSKSSTNTSTTTAPDAFPSALLSAVRIPFEDLKISDVISQGGFGEVAFGKYKNQDVAIKRLLASRRRNPKSVASFVQEIELNASLDHECLVRFVGAAWDVRENLCMVSEFMHGGDLRTLLDGYAQSGHPNGHDGGKMRTAVQVAQALSYLHGLDPPVVHRDLKSRNILLTELLDAKLIDFGVSTECHDVTMTAGVGTSLWMAPEIMLGKRYDSKADIFSFGVILSELDTHEIPYDHARDPGSNRRLASAVLNRLIYEGRLKPRFTELADPEIVALARDCLEVDPRKRPTATQVLDRIRQARRAGGGVPTRGFALETQQGRPASSFDTRTRMNDTEF